MHFLLPGRNVVSSLAIRLPINLTTCLPPCPINLITSLLIKLTTSLPINLINSLPINLTTSLFINLITSLPINLTTSLFINLSLPTDLTTTCHQSHNLPHISLITTSPSTLLINLSTVLA